MDFSWSSEQEALRDRAEQFAREHLVGNFVERERAGKFFREGWDACAREGIQGLASPESIEKIFLTLQGLGRGTPDLGFLLSLNAHIWGAAVPLTSQGNTPLVHDLFSGKSIGTHAITEPDAGSDLAGMKTWAQPSDDGFRLRGTKTYITNAPIADVFLVYAKHGAPDREVPLSIFLVRKDDPGFKVTRTFSKMGLRTAPMGEISLDVSLPRDRLVGAEGSGLARFHTALELERAGIFASVLGVMEAQLKRTIRRAQERHAFNRPIGSFQSVSNRIVDMKMRVEIGQLVLDKFIWKKMKGRRAPGESAAVKLYLSEAFVASSINAVEIHGALGYVEEGGVEHLLRDAVGGLLFSGTSDMQRNVIARLLGLTP